MDTRLVVAALQASTVPSVFVGGVHFSKHPHPHSHWRSLRSTQRTHSKKKATGRRPTCLLLTPFSNVFDARALPYVL